MKSRKAFKKENRLLLKFTAIVLVLSQPLHLVSQEDLEEGEITDLSPFEVTASGDRGYGSTATLGGTRLNIQLINAAQSVSVINREVIDDLGSINLASDAAIFASGISKRGRNSGNTNLTIRGSDAGQLSFIDGLPAGTSGEAVGGLDPIGTERLEFVKGPVGTLYGSHGGQGIQNRITKKPLSGGGTTLRLIAGSYDLMRAEVDTTGRSNEDRFGYRVALAVQEGESKTGAPNDRNAFYSFLDYDISEDSRTWLRFEWVDFQAESATSSFRAAAPDSNNPLEGRTGLGVIPLDVAGGGVNFSLHDREAYSSELGFENRFMIGDSEWALKTVGRYGEMEFQLVEFIGGTFKFIDATGEIIGTHGNTTWGDSNWVDVRTDGTLNNTVRKQIQGGVFVDLAGDFKIGPSHHKLLVYTSLEENRTPVQHRDRYSMTDLPFFETTDLPTPKPFQITGLPSEFGNPRVNREEKTSSSIFGLGVQDNVRFLDERLIFVGGVGYRTGRSSEENLLSGAAIVDEVNSDWVYKYGVVGKPFGEGLSFFFNHGETFIPMGGFDDLGNPLVNRLMESDELGIKVNLLDSRVVSTLTYFDTTENGFLIRILDDMGQQRSIQGGQLTTDGWELDLALQPTDSWSLLLAFSDFNHADENGDFVRAVPLDLMWSFITKYQFIGGPAAGLSFGLTYENTPERMGDSGNSFLIPGFEVYGAFSTYRFDDRWKVQLNVYNLTDEEYILGSANRSRIFFGDDRNVRLMANYRF